MALLASKGAKHNTTLAECGGCGKVCAINNREMTRYNRAARGAHPAMPQPASYNDFSRGHIQTQIQI